MTFGIVAVVLLILCAVVEEGSGLTKAAAICLLSALACLLLRWITGWEFLRILAKLAGAGVVLLTLINVIKKLVD